MSGEAIIKTFFPYFPLKILLLKDMLINVSTMPIYCMLKCFLFVTVLEGSISQAHNQF